MGMPNIRKLIIPPKGREFFDIDLDSADLRIVTWESDCKEMKAMFDQGLKPYVEIAKEYYHDQSITKHHPKYGTFKSFCHACLPAGHEVLTPSGWVDISHLPKGTQIAVWNDDSREIFFETPKKMNSSTLHEGEDLWDLKGVSYHQLVTSEHSIPQYISPSTKITAKPAYALTKSSRLPLNGYYEGGKIELMDKELTQIAVKWIHPKRVVDIPQEWQEPGPWLFSLTGSTLDRLLQKIAGWGYAVGAPGSFRLVLRSRSLAEWLQTLAHLRGMSSQSTFTETSQRGKYYSFSICMRSYANFARMSVTRKPAAGTKVYCPTTSTGYFLVRHDNHIMVTGNSNYLGKARNIAPRVGLTVHETEKTQKWYFERFPEIKTWQDDLIDSLKKTKMVKNVFGYSRIFFDRIEGTLFNEAVAWIPQSTVAILINKAYMAIYKDLKEVQITLQVHDSLAGTFPLGDTEGWKAKITEKAQIPLPYPEPLIIPVGIKTSPHSWGDCG